MKKRIVSYGVQGGLDYMSTNWNGHKNYYYIRYIVKKSSALLRNFPLKSRELNKVHPEKKNGTNSKIQFKNRTVQEDVLINTLNRITKGAMIGDVPPHLDINFTKICTWVQQRLLMLYDIKQSCKPHAICFQLINVFKHDNEHAQG